MQYKVYRNGGFMKVVAIIGTVAFMLADTFLMWCLLRANALYEQNENRHRPISENESDKRKETPFEEKEENF